MEQILYKTLKSERLSKALKTDNAVAIRLTEKRARLCQQFINRMDILTGNTGQKSSIIVVFLSLASSLLLLIRIMLFHPRLFEIFIFYLFNDPTFDAEELGDGITILRFEQQESAQQPEV